MSKQTPNNVNGFIKTFFMSFMTLTLCLSAYMMGLNSGGVQGSLIAQLSDCGNGMIDMDEECDDGNTANYDGCSSRCLVEELIPLYPEDVVAPLMQMNTMPNPNVAAPAPSTPAPSYAAPSPAPVPMVKPAPVAKPVPVLEVPTKTQKDEAPKPGIGITDKKQVQAIVDGGPLKMPEGEYPKHLERKSGLKEIMLRDTSPVFVISEDAVISQYEKESMRAAPTDREQIVTKKLRWENEDVLFMFLVLTFFILTVVAHLLLYSMNKTQNALLQKKIDKISKSKKRKKTKKGWF